MTTVSRKPLAAAKPQPQTNTNPNKHNPTTNKPGNANQNSQSQTTSTPGKDHGTMGASQLATRDSTSFGHNIFLGNQPNARNAAEASNSQTPNGQTPNGQTPNGQTPNGQTPNGQTPNGQTPNGQTPNRAPLKHKAVSDGQIGPTKQGDVGDCWLLSGINAVANDKDGKVWIKNSIHDNGNGTYSVTFAGAPQKSYTVTPKELQNNPNSSGDKDMAILEEAARQYFHGDISGGHSEKAMYLLTGQHSQSVTSKAQLQQIWNSDKDGISMTFSSVVTKKDGMPASIDPTGTPKGKHAFAVTNIDFKTNTVTYTNPWNSGIPRTMTIDQLLQMDRISYLEVNPKMAQGPSTNAPAPPSHKPFWL